MLRIFVTLISLLAMTGCASIAGEKTQPITFKTILDNNEVANVGCTLMNDAGTWHVTTPGSVTVHKSTGDLSVDCSKEDLHGHDTLVSKSNGAVWGNIIAGGGIGYIVDRNTGAGFNYPDTDVIQLLRIPPATGSSDPQKTTSDKPPVETEQFGQRRCAFQKAPAAEGTKGQEPDLRRGV
jgi:hypothetical protein